MRSGLQQARREVMPAGAGGGCMCIIHPQLQGALQPLPSMTLTFLKNPRWLIFVRKFYYEVNWQGLKSASQAAAGSSSSSSYSYYFW